MTTLLKKLPKSVSDMCNRHDVAGLFVWPKLIKHQLQENYHVFRYN